jgi:hypothetical protein
MQWGGGGRGGVGMGTMKMIKSKLLQPRKMTVPEPILKQRRRREHWMLAQHTGTPTNLPFSKACLRHYIHTGCNLQKVTDYSYWHGGDCAKYLYPM